MFFVCFLSTGLRPWLENSRASGTPFFSVSVVDRRREAA